MSSKIPALIAAVLVINAAMLWGTTASAQSVEFLNTIKTAEEQRQQGKLAEAFKTLTAIKPVGSNESSLKDMKILGKEVRESREIHLDTIFDET